MDILFRLSRCLWFLCSWMPLRVHYIFSDVVFFPLIYYVLRYRRALVKQQLRDSFPDYDERRLRRIERDFYRWFSDYVVETLKLMSISADEMRRRMEMVNLTDVDLELEAEGAPFCFLYLGHLGNWEWISSIPLWTKADEVCGQIYHPLHNRVMDRLFLHIRGRFGATSIAMKETLRTVLGWKREGRRAMIGFISDQSPKWEAMHHWTPFLHHDTFFFTGAEKIGRAVGARYFYVDVTRPRRGYYRAELRELKVDANSDSPYPVTDAFAQALETSICREPHLWLWTHNRWKRTREMWEKEKNKNKDHPVSRI